MDPRVPRLKQGLATAAESVSNILEIHTKFNEKCPELTWDAGVGINHITRSVTKQKRTTLGRVSDIVVEDSTPICSQSLIAPIPTTRAPELPKNLGSIGKLLTINSTHSMQKTASLYFTLGKEASLEFQNDLNMHTNVTEENHVSLFCTY